MAEDKGKQASPREKRVQKRMDVADGKEGNL